MKSLQITLILLFLSFVFLPCRSAYSFNGYMETNALHFPHKGDMFESRNRLFFEEKETSDWLTAYISGRTDALLSDREQEKKDILVRVDDAYCNLYLEKGEVKIGYSKVFWGKLDQLAPVDIVNPLDVSQLFLTAERREAKLAVPLLMVSPYFGEQNRLDLMVIPFFKKGTFDELNEKSSPFNIVYFPSPFDALPVEEQLPSKNSGNMEYGGRFSGIFREIDWSLYYFRGFCDFPMYKLTYRYDPISDLFVPDTIKAEYFTYTMFGYDFEFVRGKWGIRGEGAFFSDQGFQKKGAIDYVKGNSFHVGFGADRRFGDTYLNCSALYKKIFVESDIEERRDELTLLGNVERSFSYETKVIKLFSMFNTMSNSLFLKGTFSINLLENLWADVSIGIFGGKENDFLSRFEDSDFFYVTCKYNF